MFIVIFGVVQVSLSALAFVTGQAQLRDAFDAQVMRRCEEIAAKLPESRPKIFTEHVADVIRTEAGSPLFRDFYVQVRDASGTVMERSANLGAHKLPFDSSKVRQIDGSTHLQTLAGESVEELFGEGHLLRMATRYVYVPNNRSMYLQVATSMSGLEASLRQFRFLLLAGVPAGLLAAGVASWFVTGRALRHVNEVSRVADQIRPGQLNQRIDARSGHDEIAQMVRNVNEMLERLEAGFVSQDRFIHDASHELKTPLSTVIAEAQVLKMIAATPEQWRLFADSVEQEMRHLARVADSLLALARAGANSEFTAREVASLNDAVELAVDECRGAARHAGVSVDLRLVMAEEGEDEPMFLGDRNLITAMVSNLVRNAIRFSPRGKSVEVEVTRRDDAGVITVRDRGPGVPPELAERIFDRFAQAPGQASHRGAGLGLAIAAEVARLHGGTIHFNNLDSGGCAFAVVLPLHRNGK